MYYIGSIPCGMPDELTHFGIKGMKWGVRRFRNEDGSLTDAGKKRYYVNANGDIKRKKLYDRTYDNTYSKAMEKGKNSTFSPKRKGERAEMGESAKLIGKYALAGVAALAAVSVSPKVNKVAAFGSMIAADILMGVRTRTRIHAKKQAYGDAYQDLRNRRNEE